MIKLKYNKVVWLVYNAFKVGLMIKVVYDYLYVVYMVIRMSFPVWFFCWSQCELLKRKYQNENRNKLWSYWGKKKVFNWSCVGANSPMIEFHTAAVDDNILTSKYMYLDLLCSDRCVACCGHLYWKLSIYPSRKCIRDLSGILLQQLQVVNLFRRKQHIFY